MGQRFVAELALLFLGFVKVSQTCRVLRYETMFVVVKVSRGLVVQPCLTSFEWVTRCLNWFLTNRLLTSDNSRCRRSWTQSIQCQRVDLKRFKKGTTYTMCVRFMGLLYKTLLTLLVAGSLFCVEQQTAVRSVALLTFCVEMTGCMSCCEWNCCCCLMFFGSFFLVAARVMVGVTGDSSWWSLWLIFRFILSIAFDLLGLQNSERFNVLENCLAADFYVKTNRFV